MGAFLQGISISARRLVSFGLYNFAQLALPICQCSKDRKMLSMKPLCRLLVFVTYHASAAMLQVLPPAVCARAEHHRCPSQPAVCFQPSTTALTTAVPTPPLSSPRLVSPRLPSPPLPCTSHCSGSPQVNSAASMLKTLHDTPAGQQVWVVERGPAADKGVLRTLADWQDDYPPSLYNFVYWTHQTDDRTELPSTVALLSSACVSASEVLPTSLSRCALLLKQSCQVDACLALHTKQQPQSRCCLISHRAAPEHWELIPELIEVPLLSTPTPSLHMQTL